MSRNERKVIAITMLAGAMLTVGSEQQWVNIISALAFGTFIYVILGHTKGNNT